MLDSQLALTSQGGGHYGSIMPQPGFGQSTMQPRQQPIAHVMARTEYPGDQPATTARNVATQPTARNVANQPAATAHNVATLLTPRQRYDQYCAKLKARCEEDGEPFVPLDFIPWQLNHT